MDPMTLAAAAIALLGPFLGKISDATLGRVGETAADHAGNGIRNLYEIIKAKMGKDSYHQAILQGAEDEPGEETRIGVLTQTLGGILKDDPEFAVTLDAILNEAKNTNIQGRASGAIAGRDIHQTGTYNAGRDMTIN